MVALAMSPARPPEGARSRMAGQADRPQGARMNLLSTVAIDPLAEPLHAWTLIAAAVRDWTAAQQLALRDVVVVLPFAQPLGVARQAFARQGGWQPRVETTQTLAESLGPPAAAGGGVSFDATLDRLAMARLLRQQGFGAAWERRDARGFRLAVSATVDAAQALARVSAARPPAQREAFWSALRDLLGASAGPGALETMLLRVAAEWAAQTPAPPTDRLFAHRPAGWAILRAGGGDPLGDSLLAAEDGVPRLHLDADPPATAPFAALATQSAPRLHLCDDLEAEAQASAALVIDDLNAGRRPVALVALDRVLVRRVRALLERAGVAVADETGWRLSTTRAAARLMAWLRASAAQAGADDWLDWLKAWPPAQRQPELLDEIEARWRQNRRPDARADAAAAALLADAEAALAWADASRRRSLAAWLEALAAALESAGEWSDLAADAAGAQVLLALRLAPRDALDGHWQALAADTRMDLAAFTAWVDAELESAVFIAPASQADVVLTPLSRALLRPFGAVIVPAADARHLGACEAARGLIGESMAAQLGLETAAGRRQRERLALAQLLRQPRVQFLRRRLDGDEPLAASPDLQLLALARAQAGADALTERPWAAATRAHPARPHVRPAPSAQGDLPTSLSASRVEDLRACPYRFFARAVLGLAEDEELDRGVDKRDYGTWLHAVLHRFHATRAQAPGDDLVLLRAAAAAQTDSAPFDAAELLPFLASFESFAPAYLAWVGQAESQGWHWQRGEVALQVAPAALAPTGLRGRIDRIDTGAQGGLRLLDYKTGSAAALKAKMKPLSEDTQLAFYAALLIESADGTATGPALQAAYLTLDEADAPKLLPHADVANSAAVLLAGLGGELTRLRAGAGLPPLGEGTTCEHCEVRGLCRRDDWGDASARPGP